ncbi:MAG TPA: hypothetical protein VIY28_02730 [Pseudonocardiaceae bacterium]
MSIGAYQIEHGLLREMLRRFLLAKVESSRGDGGCGRAGAALDSLLAAHPVDQQGRCSSCRGPGWLGRRPRVCMVFRQAHYWLRQPTPWVLARLAAEWGLEVAAPLGLADPDATVVLPRIAASHLLSHVRPRPSRRRPPLPDAVQRRVGAGDSGHAMH